MRSLFKHIRFALATGIFISALATPIAAHAQTDPGSAVSGSTGVVTIPPPGPRTEVAGVTVVRENPVDATDSTSIVLGSQTEVLGQVAETDEPLALTGADLVGLSVIAAGAVAFGAVVLVARNRRRHVSS